MPLKLDKVRGKPALFYLKYIGTASAAPSTVTVTADTGGGVAGSNTIAVTALSAAIPKNTVLEFSGGAKVVVTADAAASATSLAVEAFEGADGDGIEAVAQGETATWDGLYTDIASQSLDFQVNAQTQELNPVTHGSSTSVSVSLPEVTSIAPTVTRQGLFFAEGQLVKDILTYGDTNGNWWGKFIQPDADGAAWVTREGLGVVSNVGTPSPADNLIQLSYTFRFKQAVTPSFAS